MNYQQNGLDSVAADNQALTSTDGNRKPATDSLQGQMLFMIVSHDDHCTTLESCSGLDCNCNAEVRMVGREEYLRIVGGGE